MNPWAIVAALVLVGGAVGGAGWQGYRLGRDGQIAAEVKAATFAQAAGDAASKAAVEAIGKIDIKRVTIRQELEREIRLQPVPAECDLSDSLLDSLNRSITGQEPAGAGLPSAVSAAGKDPR